MHAVWGGRIYFGGVGSRMFCFMRVLLMRRMMMMEELIGAPGR